MPIADYPVDEVVTFTGRFYSDPAQTAPVDPDEVMLRVLSPEGTSTDYEEPENPEVGVYTQEITLDEVGDWGYRWITDGPVCIVQGVVTVTGDLTVA
jgi:hypothetical protein